RSSRSIAFRTATTRRGVGDGVRRQPPSMADDSYASPNAWESFSFRPARLEALMNLLWYVALGSAVGGASRFALSTFIQQRAGAFPVGTLVVNITGSLALGFLMRYA